LPHQKFEVFQTTQKILKTSRITILRSLITNINSKAMFYAVVVMKLWFEWLSGVRGWLVNASITQPWLVG
jgi:hypothetical protein